MQKELCLHPILFLSHIGQRIMSEQSENLSHSKEQANVLASNVENIKSEIIDLQIEYTHQQDHIQVLDSVILELRSEIHALQEQVKMLEEKLNTTQQNATHFNLHEEKPPHY